MARNKIQKITNALDTFTGMGENMRRKKGFGTLTE